MSMQKLFINKNFEYDGSQLRPLYAYENYKVLGDSIVSWVGPCNITLEHMVDIEDKIESSKICGDKMLHFIIEIFGSDLTAAVSLQRLFASIVKDRIEVMTLRKIKLDRDGDDIYMTENKGQQKLSISIASKSAVSTMIHFAVNIVNDGTPVNTLCLNELGIEEYALAQEVMNYFIEEHRSIIVATKKVIPL